MKKYTYSTPIVSGKVDSLVASVYINGVQKKKKISKKLSATDQKSHAKNLIEIWSEMLAMDLNPFEKDDVLRYTKLFYKPTFSEALENYYPTLTANVNTVAGYKSKLKIFEGVFGNKLIDEITTLDVEKVLIKYINDGSWNQKTLNNCKKIIGQFFTFCVDSGWIKESPTGKIRKSIRSDKKSPDRFVPFYEEHFKIIMDVVKNYENPNLYYFICFIYHASIRPKEILSLKIKDLDLVNNQINVNSEISKNNKDAVIPIYSALSKIIDKMNLKDANKEDYIFSNNSTTFSFKKGRLSFGNKPLVIKYFTSIFREILKDLNLYDGTGYSLYSTKHTSNIDKFNSGWKLTELMKFNRHSSIQMTEEYLKNITKMTDINHLESNEI